MKKEENKEPEFYSPVYVVSDGTKILRERKDGKKTEPQSVKSGKKYSSRKNQRVEITVPGGHIIFEPLSTGNLPDEICTNKQFKEAIAANNIQEKK